MKEKVVRFYFDTVSPFSYLAWHAIHESINQVEDATIKYCPVFVTRILKNHKKLKKT